MSFLSVWLRRMTSRILRLLAWWTESVAPRIMELLLPPLNLGVSAALNEEVISMLWSMEKDAFSDLTRSYTVGTSRKLSN